MTLSSTNCFEKYNFLFLLHGYVLVNPHVKIGIDLHPRIGFTHSIYSYHCTYKCLSFKDFLAIDILVNFEPRYIIRNITKYCDTSSVDKRKTLANISTISMTNLMNEIQLWFSKWTGSTLVQIIASHCSSPSHYFNQVWFIVDKTCKDILRDLIKVQTFLLKMHWKYQLKILPFSAQKFPKIMTAYVVIHLQWVRD